MTWRDTGARLTLIAALAVSPLAAKASGQSAGVDPFAAAPIRIAAPALSLPMVDGGEFSLANRQGKFTVINFWALWCAPCQREMPALGRLKSRLAAQDIEVIAVNLGDDDRAVQRFLRRTDTGPLTILLDKKSVAADDWHVGGLPATFLVDRSGQISHAALGARQWDAPAVVRWFETLARGRGKNGEPITKNN